MEDNEFNIYHDFFISASPDKIYDALTDPNHLINWWPKKCTGKPEVGATYNFYFTEEYNWYGEVTDAQKAEKFQIRMTQSDPDWDSTSFGFELIPQDNSVQVKFWHEGWPRCNEHFRRSSFCWAILLQGLKNYLEEDIIVPFNARS